MYRLAMVDAVEVDERLSALYDCTRLWACHFVIQEK
jgi:hypothetical protein